MLPVELVGSDLRVRRPDGSLVRGAELVGASLFIDTESGSTYVRIDGVEPDPDDSSGETSLYTASVETADGWASLCGEDAWGKRTAIAVEGFWDTGGRHHAAKGRFELTCTTGAIGKCIRFGYRPWRDAEAFALHQACTRLVRADYCGDGASHTRDGTLIDVFDRKGIQSDEPFAHATFESAWAPDGAVCVAHTRVASVFAMSDLRSACPNNENAPCSEATATADPRVLLFVRSSGE